MVQELLTLPFDNDFIDKAGRHTLYNGNSGYPFKSPVRFAEGRLGTASAYFDGNAFLINTNDTTHICTENSGNFRGLTLLQLANSDDFLLGSTKNTQEWNGTYVSTNSDLNFSLDCWINLETGGQRWYPICSSAGISYGSFKVGWVLQVDTATGQLEMIGFSGGDWLGSVLRSNFKIPFNEWTHIAVSIWRVNGFPYPTAQAMYKNGIPDTGIVGQNRLIRFSNGIFCASIGERNWQYNPFFIGLGPTGIYHGDTNWYHGINPYYGFRFKGRIDNLRICLGPRWTTNTQSLLDPIEVPGIALTTTTTTTTTTASTTVGWTTYSTTTYTSTLSTTTTFYPQGIIRNFLELPFDQNTNDSTQRHFTIERPTLYSEDRIRGSHSAYFDGTSKIEFLSDESDWTLASTNYGLYGALDKNSTWHAFANIPDNSFTIDCWIKLESNTNGIRYYPICSSFNSAGTGWSFQIDIQTLKLQMVGYAQKSHLLDFISVPAKNQNGMLINSVVNLLMESSFTLELDTWIHIALVSYRKYNQIAPKIMYKNGTPDRVSTYVPNQVVWSNRGQVTVNDPTVGLGPLVLGFAPKTDMIGSKTNGDWYKGFIDYLRICEGNRFPVDGTSFTPPEDGATTTQTTVTTTTTQTTVSTTTLSTVTTSTTSGTTSLTTVTLTTGTTQTSTVTTASTTSPPEYYIDATPIMTGVNTPSGVISTNARTFSNFPLYHLFDRDLTTRWYTESARPWWVCYDFGVNNSQVIKKWALFPSGNISSWPFPKEVKLQASNDKITWVDLDFQSNLIDPENTWWESSVLLNNISYRYYQIYIISTLGGSGFEVSLSQIRLLKASPLLSSSTTASTTVSQTSTTVTTLSTTTVTTTTYTTTGTTVTYTSTSSWTTTTESQTTITPIPRFLNVSVDGVASAHGYLSNYIPDNAFDNDSNTFWLCSPYDNPPYWISYHWTDASYTVDYYKVYLTSGGRPKNWQFQGSNDGENWDILDEVWNEDSEGLIERIFSNTIAYSYYRLYITDVWSRYYGIRVNELQLYSGYHNNKPESQMHWIGYDFEQEILVQRYCMCVPQGSSFNEWKLQGSKDGIFWIDVDYQNQPDFVGWKCIDIENNNLSFNRWRLVIMNWSSYSQPGLIELELFQRP